MRNIQPLDFVRTPKGSIALVGEVNHPHAGQNGVQCSVIFIDNVHREKVAWWNNDELELINTLPHLLAQNLVHSFGTGKKVADETFKNYTDD